MSPYVTMADLNALIPGPFLVEALDDDNDGTAEVPTWEGVRAAVEQEINGILSVRFTTPFATPPPLVLSAARTLAAETCYLRRGQKENPFTEQAAAVRRNLTAIAKGEMPLTPDIQRAKPPVSAVTEPASSTSRRGARLA